MSVLTGLISGAAKGAAKFADVAIDQELKKQLLDIQEQKELRLAEARSRLELEGYKAKGDYDTSQIGVKAAATADAAKTNAGKIGEATAAQEAAAFAGGTATRAAKFTEEQGNRKTSALADANTALDPTVRRATQAKADDSESSSTKGLRGEQISGLRTERERGDLLRSLQDKARAAEARGETAEAELYIQQIGALRETGVSRSDRLSAGNSLIKGAAGMLPGDEQDRAYQQGTSALSGILNTTRAARIPQEAIDALKANPSKAKEFDQMYGAGLSNIYLGKSK